jgi:hypothetical protein
LGSFSALESGIAMGSASDSGSISVLGSVNALESVSALKSVRMYVQTWVKRKIHINLSSAQNYKVFCTLVELLIRFDPIYGFTKKVERPFDLSYLKPT